MVTGTKTEGNNEISAWAFKGKSTDPKPTGKWNGTIIKNGSTYFAMDTQEVYFYDGESETWFTQP